MGLNTSYLTIIAVLRNEVLSRRVDHHQVQSGGYEANMIYAYSFRLQVIPRVVITRCTDRWSYYWMM